jgi:hypothetical protein
MIVLVCAFFSGHAAANQSYGYSGLFVAIGAPQLAFLLMELAT